MSVIASFRFFHALSRNFYRFLAWSSHLIMELLWSINNKSSYIYFDNLSLRILQRNLKLYKGLHLPLGIYLFSSPLLSSLPNLFHVNNPTLTFLLLSFYFSLAAVLHVGYFRVSKMESPNVSSSPLVVNFIMRRCGILISWEMWR